MKLRFNHRMVRFAQAVTILGCIAICSTGCTGQALPPDDNVRPPADVVDGPAWCVSAGLRPWYDLNDRFVTCVESGS